MSETSAKAMQLSERTRRRVAALARSLTINTATNRNDRDEEEARLRQWQELLPALFPLVHQFLERHAPDAYRLVYRWPASPQASPQSPPVLLMAHYDVVPADPKDWSCDPFGGEVRDGAVWGRGALDNKLSHIALLQAVEELLETGFQPNRPIYLAFGGDEEVGGRRGAQRIAAEFAEQGVRFATTLDEGAIVAQGMLPGLDGAVGLIGCGEKGHINVELTADSGGGHASNPPHPDSGLHLARTLHRVLRKRQPVRRCSTVTDFIRALGRQFSGVSGWLLRSYPMTAPLVHRVLSRLPETDAMLRTTQALTMLRGSDAPNVLPRVVQANLNMRLLPGARVEETLQSLQGRVGTSTNVALAEGLDNNEAPPESPASGPAYSLLRESILHVWPGIPVLPYLVTATTDSRHYAGVSDTVYRFLPFELTKSDLKGIHGVDEHVSIANVDRAVDFYDGYIRRISEAQL